MSPRSKSVRRRIFKLEPEALKLVERHEFLLKHPPTCQKCKGVKVKLKQSGQKPAIWQCQLCSHPFLYEPPE